MLSISSYFYVYIEIMTLIVFNETIRMLFGFSILITVLLIALVFILLFAIVKSTIKERIGVLTYHINLHHRTLF